VLSSDIVYRTEITQEQAIVIEVPFGAEPGQMGFMSYTIPVSCLLAIMVRKSESIHATHAREGDGGRHG
jgi:hypothetical protein